MNTDAAFTHALLYLNQN